MSAEINIIVDSYANAASVRESNDAIEKMLGLLKQVEKYKGVLSRATSINDALKATNELAKISKEIIKIQQEEERLAQIRLKNSQQAVIGEEKVAQAKNATTVSTVKAERAEEQRAAAARKTNAEIKKQEGLLNGLKSSITRLNSLKMQAGTPEQIARINKLIDTQKAKLTQLANTGKQTTNTFSNALSSYQFKFNFLGNTLGNLALRAASEIKQLGVESIHAFIEAEKNANQLKFSLENVAGEGVVAFNKLIEQSEKLQDNGIFSDDAIQQAQQQLVNYGMTSDQIEKIIPQIADLAAVSGKDLGSATDIVIKGINGQTKGLKMLGIDYKSTGDKAQNLAILTEKLTKFQGANAAQLENNAGKIARLENAWDDFKENIGEFLVNGGSEFLNFWDVLSGKISVAEAGIRALKDAIYDKSSGTVEDFLGGLTGTIDEKKKKIDEFIKGIEAIATAKTKASIAGEIGDKEYVATIQALTQNIKDLKKAKDDLSKEPIAVLGGGDDDAEKKLTDLSDRIAAIQKQRESDEANRTKDALKRKASDDAKYAEQTIANPEELSAELTRISENLSANLLSIDTNLLEKKAQIDIAAVNREVASAKQKAELIEQINLKLVEDIAALNKKASEETVDDSKEAFEKLAAEIDRQNTELTQKAEDDAEKRKDLENQRFEDNNKLRLALAKGAEAKRQAEISNILLQRGKDLEDLENERRTNTLLTEEQYETNRQLILAESEEKIRTIEKQSQDERIAQIYEFGNKIAEAALAKSEREQAAVEKQVAEQDKAIEYQRQRAIAGKENDLIQQEQLRAKSERAAIAEAEKQKKIKQAQAYWELFTKFASSDGEDAAEKAALEMAQGIAVSALFAEKGGMGEDLKETTTLTADGWSKSHASGDKLTLISPKEGLLTEQNIEALGGKEGFYTLKHNLEHMANNPIPDNVFAKQNDSFTQVALVKTPKIDIKDLTEAFTEAIQHIPRDKWEIDSLGNYIHTLQKKGSRVVTEKGSFVRPYRQKYIE